MDEGEGSAALGAALGAALQRLLLETYHLAPDDLAAAVAAVCQEELSAEVDVLVADLDQEQLRPLDPATGPAEEFDVDGPGPGAAFRLERPIEEPAEYGRRLWVVVKDSSDRLGVLGVVDDGTLPVESWSAVASLVGELIVSKSAYGDSIELRRRAKPMSLPAEMRWGLLPPMTYTSREVQVDGILRPSYGVAGDAFDYGVTGERASFAIIDALGHGLEASRMANVAISSYRNSRRNGLGPAASLLAMDEVITTQFGGSRFVTAQVGGLDLDTGVLTLANAGHPPPLLIGRDGRVRSIDCPPSRPAGLELRHPPETTTQLADGDVVVLHTDGATEARAPDGEPFGEARFAGLLARLLAEDIPLAEVLRQAVRRISDHAGGRPGDDTTVLLVQWGPDRVGPVLTSRSSA